MSNDTKQVDKRPIVWFDIDNTLYSASTKISEAMGNRIHDYFVSLGLSHEDASDLHLRYYTQYGLALRGLARYHDVDPLDFDSKCDGSLPLEEMISYDPAVRKLLEDINRSKARVWALTNAYKNHAQRVLRILKLDDLVEDIAYCNYEIPNFSCKPEEEFYHAAMANAGVSDPSKCYFIDDSLINIRAAHALGWGHCVHFHEVGLETMEGGKMKLLGDVPEDGRLEDAQIRHINNLEQLRDIWPEIFKETSQT